MTDNVRKNGTCHSNSVNMYNIDINYLDSVMKKNKIKYKLQKKK